MHKPLELKPCSNLQSTNCCYFLFYIKDLYICRTSRVWQKHRLNTKAKIRLQLPVLKQRAPILLHVKNLWKKHCLALQWGFHCYFFMEVADLWQAFFSTHPGPLCPPCKTSGLSICLLWNVSTQSLAIWSSYVLVLQITCTGLYF